MLNAYGSPVVVRDQNEKRAAARREEDVSEPRSVVNRNFNFSFIFKCMLLFAPFFPFQFLTKTNETELLCNCKTTCKMGLTSLHDFYGS